MGITLSMRLLGQLAHHLAFELIDALDLLGSEELVVLLVILLAQIEQLLAALHASLDGLFDLGIRHFGRVLALVTLMPWTQGPDFLLVFAEGLGETFGGGIVEGQFFGNVLGLLLGQFLTRDALTVLTLALCLGRDAAHGHHDGAECNG